MCDFYKNKEKDYLEGFLGDEEDFNGVVFMLREPDHKQVKAGDEDKRFFWFKRVVYDEKYYEDDLAKNEITTNKRVATAFKNRFFQMLQVVGLDKEVDLKNAVFCNVHPEWGDTVATEEYEKTKKGTAVYKMEVLVEQCIRRQNRKSLTIFTCSDIYKILEQKYTNEGSLKRKEDGLKYYFKGEKEKKQISEPRGKMVVNTGEYELTIYEIIHPTRSPHVAVNESK